MTQASLAVPSASSEAPTAGCEREELHLSGAIQPHGALLRIESASGRITHASSNLRALLDVDARAVLGRPHAQIDALAGLDLASLPAADPPARRSVVLLPDGKACDCTIVRATDYTLLELESASVESTPAKVRIARLVQTAPPRYSELLEYHLWLLDAIRSVVGFTRLMIYRFHEDWSGEVVAERVEPGLEPYLGLRYPASDIPEIARALYRKNPCRTIAEVGAEPVPVLGRTPEPPDLTYSDLRSVSPVHLQYLKNMDVGASFSIPILSVESLWGLVACHHAAPLRPTRAQREACVELATAHSIRLRAALGARTLQQTDAAERRTQDLSAKLHAARDPFGAVRASEDELSALVSARGVALGLGSRLVHAGHVPPAARLEQLDAWFTRHADVLVQDEGWTQFLDPAPAADDTTRGVLAVKARTASGWVRFYWFRPAEVQEIAWGGKPEKAVSPETGALSPRSSFSRWVEVRRDRSQPWSTGDKLMAWKFRQTLPMWTR